MKIILMSLKKYVSINDIQTIYHIIETVEEVPAVLNKILHFHGCPQFMFNYLNINITVSNSSLTCTTNCQFPFKFEMNIRCA